ncbi:hypothetical protein T484DRAFT_3399053 [Baffinella frigidus]|nr:hypothetical protein T484DRAFT_3399053 [Cryptophyta sp. CCMP2293]
MGKSGGGRERSKPKSRSTAERNALPGVGSSSDESDEGDGDGREAAAAAGGPPTRYKHRGARSAKEAKAMKQQDKTDKAEALGRAQEIAHIRHAAAVAHHRGGGVPLTGAPPPIPEASELEEEDPAKIRQRAREARAAEGVLLHSLGLQHEDADEEEGEELEEPGAPDEEGDGAEEEHAGAKKEEGQEAGGFAERKEDRKLGFRGRGGKTREWLSQGAVPEEVLAAQNTFLPRGEAGRALKPEKADGEGVKKKKKPAAGPGWSSGPVSQGPGSPPM